MARTSSTQLAPVEIVTDTPAVSFAAVVRVDIQDINLLHHQATGAAEAARAKAEEAAHFALLAGTRLEQLREATPHGEWGTLFSGRKNPNSAQIGECAEFEFSQDTAARYIEVAKRIRLERGMSGKAQKQLATIASAPEIDDSAREFLNKLTKGQTLRQLYLDLEVITAPAKADKPAKPEEAAPPVPAIRKSEKQAKLEDAREWFHVWREKFESLVKIGALDDLDKPGLLEMKEFAATLRDRVNARLK